MRFSIITLCFNSTKTLHKTYESLCKQTFKDFEWILIDDLSSDGTQDLIKKYAEEAPFTVNYHLFEENHYASKSMPKGLELAKGEYSCMLDHDDQLVDTTLEKANRYLLKYEDKVENLVGVSGRCLNEKGEFIGEKYKTNEYVTTEGIIRYKDCIDSELFNITRTEVLEPLFNEMKKGFTAGYVYAHIHKQGGKYIFLNDIFRVYDTVNPESFTNNKNINLKFPENRLEARIKYFDAYGDVISLRPIDTLKSIAYLRSLMLDYNINYPLKDIKSFSLKVFFVLAYPFGYLRHKKIL